MAKSCLKYAVHKAGTQLFGSLCMYRKEAEDLLEDLHKNIRHMPDEEKSKFKVVEVKLEWDE